jgi:hypothetical protein
LLHKKWALFTERPFFVRKKEYDVIRYAVFTDSWAMFVTINRVRQLWRDNCSTFAVLRKPCSLNLGCGKECDHDSSAESISGSYAKGGNLQGSEAYSLAFWLRNGYLLIKHVLIICD